jgi:hypothetical protein
VKQNRQGPALNEHLEGNLLHRLETRADQGSGRHRRQFSGAETISYGTSTASSGLSSSFRNIGTIRQKPRMINFLDSNRTVNFTDASTKQRRSSTPGNASMSRTSVSNASQSQQSQRRG